MPRMRSRPSSWFSPVAPGCLAARRGRGLALWRCLSRRPEGTGHPCSKNAARTTASGCRAVRRRSKRARHSGDHRPGCSQAAGDLSRCSGRLRSGRAVAKRRCRSAGLERRHALRPSREPGGSWRIGSAKPGVTLPAGGLVTLLGTNASVRAELAEMVIGLGTEAIGVPTSVAALVEGAVQTMFISKLKTVAIAMLVVCAMGYGAWAAVGEGGGPPQVSNATQQPRKLVRNAAG